MTGPQSGAALLARINPQLREEQTNICLRPDLLDEWEAANIELAEQITGEESGRARMGSGGASQKKQLSAAAKKIAKRIEELEAEIMENSMTCRFRALPKDEWQVLCDLHPPRKDNQLDTISGFDRDAVIDAAVRECMYDPVFEDCTEQGCEHLACGSWQQLVKVCNSGEWQELRRVANEVNGRVNPAPKSELASRVLTNRVATSKRRVGGQDRAPAGGTAGSPSK